MTYLISDIHGMYYTFKALLDKIFSSDPDPSFVFVGDYVDAGVHAFQVIEELINLQKKGHIALKGNHDDIFDMLVNEKSISKIPFVGDRLVLNGLNFGLDKTFVSYGVLDYDPRKVVEEFRKAVPKEHKDFIRNLPIFWQNETHFACHAFMNPYKLDFSLDKDHTETLWGQFTHFDAHWDKIGVFGHVSSTMYGLGFPYKSGQIRLIDNGGVHGPSLLAYCCETDEYIEEPVQQQDLEF